MRYPTQLLFKDGIGNGEAHGTRLQGGQWLIDWLTHCCVETLYVDQFPDNWIEQLRRTVNVARRIK